MKGHLDHLHLHLKNLLHLAVLAGTFILATAGSNALAGSVHALAADGDHAGNVVSVTHAGNVVSVTHAGNVVSVTHAEHAQLS